MHSHVDSAFLLPEMVTENSRFSTPRSSVGDGISTDCDADVESNMSANSEETSPHRRRSSYGIYGIVPANRASMLAKQAEHLQKASKSQESVTSAWKSMATTHKLAFISSIVILFIMIFSFLFLFPGCKRDCERNSVQTQGKEVLKSKWPLLVQDVFPQTRMVLADVNGDMNNDVVVAVRQNTSSTTGLGDLTARNSSVIFALDGRTGMILKKVYLDFPPYWIYIEPNDKINVSCFVISQYGFIAKLLIAAETTAWKIKPCSEIHAVLLIKDIDLDSKSDLLVVCSWTSAIDSTISGIALVSSADGNIIGSKIRYQLGQMPSPFLIQHMNAKNETCILFGTQRHGKSTVLAVRLKRLIEIATGTRSKVNLVSENPLVVAKNVRTDVQAAYEDISGDGVKDIGFVLQHGMISFIDGATLTLRKTINARHGRITRLSVLLATSFSRPLLAVLKNSKEICKQASLNIYDFRNAFDPYMIKLPFKPLLVSESNLKTKKRFVFWLANKHVTCAEEPKNDFRNESKENESRKEIPSKETNEGDASSGDSTIDDVTDDIDIDAIDKDVLDNLREYVGIDDKGVTRHHKLFHLVCNYLLLRFLISYGITTDSVLKDFKSTRNHLLNLSSKNLGRALTDQLKGLLAADYDKDIDIPPWFDDVENDIDWLKDVGSKKVLKTKRDIKDAIGAESGNWFSGGKMKLAALDGIGEETWRASLTIPEPLKKAFLDKDDIETKQWTADLESLFSKKVGHRMFLKDLKSFQESEQEVADGKSLEKKKNDVHSSLSSMPCYLPVPTFKSLEISKMSYKWRNITAYPNNGISASEIEKEGRKRIKCKGVQMKVHDMLLQDDHLYYTLTYSKGSLKSRVLTQINRVKLSSKT